MKFFSSRRKTSYDKLEIKHLNENPHFLLQIWIPQKQLRWFDLRFMSFNSQIKQYPTKIKMGKKGNRKMGISQDINIFLFVCVFFLVATDYLGQWHTGTTAKLAYFMTHSGIFEVEQCQNGAWNSHQTNKMGIQFCIHPKQTPHFVRASELP